MSNPRGSSVPITTLHPEHLFDKLGAGRLTPSEHRRLRSHVAACETCRFELLVRGDLAHEIQKRAEPRATRSQFGLAVVDG